MPLFKPNIPLKGKVDDFGNRLKSKIGEALPAFAIGAIQTAGFAISFRRSRARPLKGETSADFQFREAQFEVAERQSYLGTPVHTQIQIQGGQFFELEDIEGNNPIEYEGIVMQTALVDVSMSKNIVKTAIQGRDGTVKEYVSLGDYLITIQGNIIGITEGNTVEDIGNVYPAIDTERLIQICQIPDAIEVTSEFLQLFGISQMVISDFKFAELQGFRNMQPFQITALSDTPINLEEL